MLPACHGRHIGSSSAAASAALAVSSSVSPSVSSSRFSFPVKNFFDLAFVVRLRSIIFEGMH